MGNTFNLAYEASTDEIVAITETILKKYGLDFTIAKLPLVGQATTADGNGIIHLPTKDFGLFHSKTKECLNTVKESYRVSQNHEVVEVVLKGMQGFGEISVKRAGSLFGGRKIYIQLEIKGVARVGEDQVKRFITIIDSNDGSTGLSVGIGDLTMSCKNQFFRFYKAGELKMRHSNSMDAKIKEMPNLITLALSESMKLVNAYQTFQKTKVTQTLVHSLVKELVGMDRAESLVKENVTTKAINNMEKLYSNIAHQMADKGNNLWGLHSGVTRWTTHEKQAPSRENGRLESIIAGTNYKTNQKSLEFALKKAKVTL